MAENNDNLEIERRWILKNVPQGQKCNEQLEIKQFYISGKSDEITERIRETWANSNFTFTHTTKERKTDMTVIELEKEISEDDFREYRDKTRRRIDKTRMEFHHDGLKFEVDLFHGMHLVIMEVELPSEDHEFEIPGFIEDQIICEITGMKKFSNSNLAI